MDNQDNHQIRNSVFLRSELKRVMEIFGNSELGYKALLKPMKEEGMVENLSGNHAIGVGELKRGMEIFGNSELGYKALLKPMKEEYINE